MAPVRLLLVAVFVNTLLWLAGNKAAMDSSNPMNTGGWNEIKANTTLLDHTMKAIARPNNDTLYI